MTRRHLLGLFANSLHASDAIGCEFLVWDVKRRGVVEDRRETTAFVAPGSLLKPFVALAADRTLRNFHCDGGGCWLPSGHGSLHLDTALSVSCNAYFRELSKACSALTLQRLWRDAGLIDLSGPLAVDARWGLDPSIKVDVTHLCQAYAWTSVARGPRAAAVQHGLRLAASRGTAHALRDKLPQWPILAKTGTSQCAHSPQTNEDGMCIAVAPANDPRYVVWSRSHGVSGSHAARDTARVLARYLGVAE